MLRLALLHHSDEGFGLGIVDTDYRIEDYTFNLDVNDHLVNWFRSRDTDYTWGEIEDYYEDGDASCLSDVEIYVLPYALELHIKRNYKSSRVIRMLTQAKESRYDTKRQRIG